MTIFNRKSFEPEKIPWPTALFYNFIPAKLLLPTYHQIVEELFLENRGVLVDIGTGPGILVQLIAEKYPNLRVFGIDISETMIKIARKKNKFLPNLRFKTMDAKEMKFPEESVDYIISTLSFHHWKDPLKVLNEIYRILKPEGTAWIYDGYSEVSDENINKGLKSFLGIKIPPGIIRKVFSRHGFSKKEYDSYVKTLIKESFFREFNFGETGITIKIELKK